MANQRFMHKVLFKGNLSGEFVYMNKSLKFAKFHFRGKLKTLIEH